MRIIFGNDVFETKAFNRAYIFLQSASYSYMVIQQPEDRTDSSR